MGTCAGCGHNDEHLVREGHDGEDYCLACDGLQILVRNLRGKVEILTEDLTESNRQVGLLLDAAGLDDEGFPEDAAEHVAKMRRAYDEWHTPGSLVALGNALFDLADRDGEVGRIAQQLLSMMPTKTK